MEMEEVIKKVLTLDFAELESRVLAHYLGVIMEKEFFIAGVQHHKLPRDNNLKNDLAGKELPFQLVLEPEPDNPYDPNAVQITHEGAMLGYVPKKFSSEVAALLEVGIEVKCELIEFNASAKPWEMAKVKLSTEE